MYITLIYDNYKSDIAVISVRNIFKLTCILFLSVTSLACRAYYYAWVCLTTLLVTQIK